MRFKRHIELEHGLRQIDIAPLVDVIFQLLIFFMLTSSFIIPSGIRVNLPKAVTSQMVKSRSLEVVVSGENVIYIDSRVVTIQELKSILKGLAAHNQPLLIKADRRAQLGRVVEIWDMARNLGLSQVNIATFQE
ncbi:MAG: biopolymer transporter ExbD [Candidatus Omnitrophica bacterium]|nr:biopolymer transporter ExbD [Candidatus Omnitrophota bacterium]